MHKPFHITSRGVAVALAMAMAVPPAVAADWELNPRIEAGYLFDDNYRLTSPGTEIEVQGPIADAALEMRALTPASEFSFTPRVRATYFPDEKELDSTDYFAIVDWRHRGQRVRSRVRADFAQQDVVNSEQPDAELGTDLGVPDIGDSGRVFVRNRRDRVSLRPSLEFDLSARRAIELAAGYTDVTYDEVLLGAQTDYSVTDFTAGLVTRLTEANSLTVRARGARYDIDTQGESTGYGAEVQWDRRTVTDARYFLRAGAQDIELATGESETAYLAGAGVSVVVGRNELFADLSRAVGPSSAGVVVTRDALRLRWTRAMTPRLSFVAGLRGTRDDDVNPDSDFQPRSYATGDVGLQWRWREEFSLRASYDYTWQKFDDALVDDAKSSGAMLTVLYQPLQRRR